MMMAVTEGAGMIVAILVVLFLVGVLMLIDLPYVAFISIAVAGAIIIYKLSTGGKK